MHNLLDGKYAVDRHQCHMSAKFDVFVDVDHSKHPTSAQTYVVFLCAVGFF